MKFLDANVILRYLTRDDEAKAAACFEFLQRVKRGEEELAVSEALVTEVVYVLSSPALYHLKPDEIRSRLVPILSLRGLKVPKERVILRALDLYATYPALDFVDVLSAAHMENQGIDDIFSYDRDFDRIAGVRRLEP